MASTRLALTHPARPGRHTFGVVGAAGRAPGRRARRSSLDPAAGRSGGRATASGLRPRPSGGGSPASRTRRERRAVRSTRRGAIPAGRRAGGLGGLLGRRRRRGGAASRALAREPREDQRHDPAERLLDPGSLVRHRLEVRQAARVELGLEDSRRERGGRSRLLYWITCGSEGSSSLSEQVLLQPAQALEVRVEHRGLAVRRRTRLPSHPSRHQAPRGFVEDLARGPCRAGGAVCRSPAMPIASGTKPKKSVSVRLAS